MKTAFWVVFGAALVLQVICVGIANTTSDPVYAEVVMTFLAFFLLLVIAIANTRFRMRSRMCRDLSLWIGVAGFVVWQLWVYPHAFIGYLNEFHGVEGMVWTDDAWKSWIYLLDEDWKTLGYDPQYAGQASAHPPWIDD